MINGSSRQRGQWVAAVAAVLLVLLPAAPAAAHNSLTGSDPADGARLDKPPTQVRLTFLSRLDPETTKITITGPDDRSAAAGEPRFDGSRVTVPFAPGPAGRYTVAYQVASGDGHPVKGDIEFTLTTGAAPASPSAAAVPTAAPAADATTDATTGAPAATPTGAASAVAEPVERTATDRGTSWWPWLAGGLVALVALAGGALWLRSRRRPS